MNNWVKVGLPIGLGVVAATLNWLVLQSKLTPHDYVVVSQNVKAGELFTDKKLQQFTVKGIDEGSLDKTAVKWSDRAILFNSPCVRDLRKGDLVLWRDAPSARKEVVLNKGELGLQVDLEGVKYEPRLLLVGNEIGFVLPRSPAGKAAASPAERGYVVEGPFRIVSVGRRVSSQAEGEEGDTGANRVITIAIQAAEGESVDEKTARVIEARKSHGIQGIVLYPAGK